MSKCPDCGAEYRAPNFPRGATGSFYLGCDCPVDEPPSRHELKRRARMPRRKLLDALDLLVSILDDGKLRNEHCQKAEELGVWKP